MENEIYQAALTAAAQNATDEHLVDTARGAIDLMIVHWKGSESDLMKAMVDISHELQLKIDGIEDSLAEQAYLSRTNGG